jgi:hypothetical protein
MFDALFLLLYICIGVGRNRLVLEKIFQLNGSNGSCRSDTAYYAKRVSRVVSGDP